jgi:hypothetical protein
MTTENGSCSDLGPREENGATGAKECGGLSGQTLEQTGAGVFAGLTGLTLTYPALL